MLIFYFFFIDCTSDPACLRCGPEGCIKCKDVIIYGTRQCVTNCPPGYEINWSVKSGYMGRICESKSSYIGINKELLTVLVGIAAGVFLCILMITTALIIFRYKSKLKRATIDNVSETEDTPERKEFLKQVESLRPHAHTFLGMLNDTRRQVRELHQEGDNVSATYRPILRDLAKILFILNKPNETLTVPNDWEHLYGWAEKTLKRFKRMSEISQPQVAQLVNFLQAPVRPFDSTEVSRTGTLMSTFKPDRPSGSSLSLQDVAIKKFNSNYDLTFNSSLNPQWKFDYSVVGQNYPKSCEFNPSEWKSSKEYLNGVNSQISDDEFCQLGFRPQDEITTEL